MSTAALQQVWDTILGYNLTTANKRWLAEHLIEQVETETKAQMKPYTMAELNARIDRAKAKKFRKNSPKNLHISEKSSNFAAKSCKESQL